MLRLRRYGYTARHWAIGSRFNWFLLDVNKYLGKRHWGLKIGELRIDWR